MFFNSYSTLGIARCLGMMLSCTSGSSSCSSFLSCHFHPPEKRDLPFYNKHRQLFNIKRRHHQPSINQTFSNKQSSIYNHWPSITNEHQPSSIVAIRFPSVNYQVNHQLTISSPRFDHSFTIFQQFTTHGITAPAQVSDLQRVTWPKHCQLRQLPVVGGTQGNAMVVSPVVDGE